MGIEEVATLVEAAERGSMAGASRALGVPTSTVSRRIHRLELELGVQLVESSTRLFRLTEHGAALLQRAKPAVRELQEAMHAISHGDPVQTQLRISVPQDIGASAAMCTLLKDFRDAHPQVELLLDLTNRQVDLTAEAIDFAFRAHLGPLRGRGSLMTRRLTLLSAGFFASPSYLEGAPPILQPADLADHVMILPTFGWPWRLENLESGQSLELDLKATVQSTSFSFMRPATSAHMGIAPMPKLLAAPYLKSGELLGVLPEWQLPAGSLSLLWPKSRLDSPQRRAFLDFVVVRASAWS